MDELKAHEIACPLCASRINKLFARIVRIEKQLQNKKPVVLTGRPSQRQIERAIHDMTDEA